MDVSYRFEGERVYADVVGAPANMEFYGELRTKATGDNQSTVGATAGVHKTVAADGSVSFWAPIDLLYPDEPRAIQLFGPLSEPQIVA